MISSRTLLFFLFFQAWSFNAAAASNTSTEQFAKQRKLFEQADAKSWRIKSHQYQQQLTLLEGYPLKPYFEQKRLLQNVFLSNKDAISKFLQQYENTPLDWQLRKKWLNYLARRGRGELFLQAYKPTNDAKLQCLALSYELAKGAREQQLLAQVTPLWISGKSQPKECDALFELWQQKGYRSTAVVWQRLVLAATKGQHTLIPYLSKLLPAEQRYLGELWHKVRRDPAYVSRLNKFPGKDQREVEIITYGLKRFIWRDQDRAMRAYDQAKTKFKFSTTQQQQITLKFALALASKKHQAAEHWLHLIDDSLLDDHIIQWRVADSLRQFNWQKVKQEMQSLPADKGNKNSWRYWLARALQQEEQVEDANAIFKELAAERHYYGFLAAGQLQYPVALQHAPLTITAKERQQVMKHPAAWRAFELFYLQRYRDARREWNYWLAHLTDREKLVAAKIANEISWFDRAIFTLAKVGYLDDVNLRFPIAYGDEFEYYAEKNQIRPSWALAISRRESSFMPDANSSAGAKGLMQIMPRTAKQVTKRKVSNSQLFNAKKNISIGTEYLSYLLDRHQGNHVLATAAYNAGPYRIDSWLKSQASLPADVWIETIPFKETREYVKSVMAYRQIYQQQLGEEHKLFEQLIETSIEK
jgi:soluble lytic murein transglycosylase